MVTGNHTAVHLKDNKVWSTLKTIPLLHYELVDRCNIHLVYMGFGIFLQLKTRQMPITTRILGTITSDDPDVRANFHLLVKTEKVDVSDEPTRSTASATCSTPQFESTHSASLESQVDIKPVCICLTKLDYNTVRKYSTKKV